MYTISKIASILSAKALQIHDDAVIDHILLDSRKLIFVNSTLFFAIPGPRRSGSLFIPELYEKGVRNFVLDESFEVDSITHYPEANFLLVKDVIKALQILSRNHRESFDYPVIGITGSNGKTIVKEWLYQSLCSEYHIVRSPKSYNSQIGVPLSIWQMRPEHSLGIFEAGISKTGEMQQLQSVIQPAIGILNFVGDAHDEGFGNLFEKVNEKLQLFAHAKFLIYCSDNDVVNQCVQKFITDQNPSIRLFDWSSKHQAIIEVKSIIRKDLGAQIFCLYQGVHFDFFIPFSDEASIYNAITCCATLFCLGKDTKYVSNVLKELKPIAMRLELKQGNHQCSIINDSYSADISSLNIALDFLSQQDLHAKKTIILSDILELGVSNNELIQELSSIISQKNIFRFIGIGPQLKSNPNQFNSIPHRHFFSSTEEFLDSIKTIDFNDEAILLKGARVFEFERISKALEKKIHDTVLEINLTALRNNVNAYRQQLNRNVKLMAMVKAFSYGSGAHEVANLLQHEGVEYLAVAYADEGVELRKAGIHLPIMVMNPSVDAFDVIVKNQLEPELFSFGILTEFEKYLEQHQLHHYPVHIKLDTGMHRLGFMNDEMNELSVSLKNNSSLFIKSIFSHLVGSENPDLDDFTLHQANSFHLMCKKIESVIDYSFIKHMANTSAILRHPQLQLDMVRVGIGLYGIDNNMNLQNVTTLKSTIAQIKQLQKGETVGYGRKGVLERDTQIATIRIGYADGYSRKFGNGIGKMLVNSALAPVIGNVCMDMTMIDITGIKAEEGDEVIIFGENLPVQELACWSDTISYEILTNISQRVKRVYFEE